MTANERRQEILALINSVGKVRASDLAESLNVTPETIRKDLIYLNNKKLLKKGHGVAQAINEYRESPILDRVHENANAKRAIAELAVKQLADCSVIFVDAGSTTTAFAGLLELRPQLAVITNSFSVVTSLQETGNTIYFIGGEVSRVTQSTSGFWASNELDSIKIDIAFLGTSGFQSHNGPCTKHFSDAQFKHDVIKSSNRVIILADSTKFESNAIMQYADWSDIDLLITDSGVSKEQREKVAQYVNILVAE